MRKFILLVALALITLGCEGQKKKAKDTSNEPSTTYYFIRHAEKDLSDPSNRNPDLTAEGEARAELWKNYFLDKDIDAVYSTNYLRTMRTAQPTADAYEVEIQLYNPSNLNSKEFKEATQGKNVVVVGHSNTTPQFASKVMGMEPWDSIDESEYDHLIKVTLENGEWTFLDTRVN